MPATKTIRPLASTPCAWPRACGQPAGCRRRCSDPSSAADRVKCTSLETYSAAMTMNLHRAIDHALCRFRGEHLGHSGCARDARGALVLAPCRSVDKKRRGVDLGCAFRNGCLCQLQVGECVAK